MPQHIKKFSYACGTTSNIYFVQNVPAKTNKERTTDLEDKFYSWCAVLENRISTRILKL